MRNLFVVAAALLHSATALATESALSAEMARRIELFETGLRPAATVVGEPSPRWTLEERMAHWRTPALSVAVIRDGAIAWARGYGELQRGDGASVDASTVFSVGSLSKVAAATIALRLVDAGALELDRDVNVYLQSWRVPASELAANENVTLRRLLSHTAGLSVSGFKNFRPDEPYPTLIEVLRGEAPAKNDPVEIIIPPGTRAQYSGGGTTVVELLIEDVTGTSFPIAASRRLFAPLGMSRSTFENPLPANRGNIAKAHDINGAPAALPRGFETMPQRAASGLWTTPSDYAKLMIALMQAYQGEGKFLSPRLAQMMMTEVGASSFGLGPVMSGRGVSRRFAHSGGNDSYRAYMEGFPATGDGVVVFTNSRSSLNLIREVLRSLAAAEGLPSGLSVRAPRVSLSNGQLDELAGEYVVRDTGSILRSRMREARERYRFSRRGDGLYVEVRAGDVDTPQEQGMARLVALDSTHFVFDEVSSTTSDLQHLEFLRGSSGEVIGLVVRVGDYSLEATKVSQARAAPLSSVDRKRITGELS